MWPPQNQGVPGTCHRPQAGTAPSVSPWQEGGDHHGELRRAAGSPHCTAALTRGDLGKALGVRSASGASWSHCTLSGRKGVCGLASLLLIAGPRLGFIWSLLLPRSQLCLPSGCPGGGGLPAAPGTAPFLAGVQQKWEALIPSLALPWGPVPLPQCFERGQGPPLSSGIKVRSWCWGRAVSSPPAPGRGGQPAQGCGERLSRARGPLRCLSVPAGTARQWSESEIKLHAVRYLHFHLKIGFLNRNAVFRESKFSD